MFWKDEYRREEDYRCVMKNFIREIALCLITGLGK